MDVECVNKVWRSPSQAAVPSDAPQWWLDEIEEENGSPGGDGCRLAANPPDERTCAEINERKEELREARDEDGDNFDTDMRRELDELESLGLIIRDDCWGELPSDRYDLTWADGGEHGGNSWSRYTGWFASILFAVGKLTLRISLWLVGYAFTFDISEYRATVADLAARIDRDLIHIRGHDFSLVEVAWFAAVAGAGMLALQNQSARAGREILVTIVLVGLASVAVGPVSEPLPEGGGESPAYRVDGYMDSFAGLVDTSSLAPLLIARSRSPNEDLDEDGVEELLRDSQGALHEEFIEAPYDYINWGREDFSTEPRSGASLSCAEVRRNILSVVGKPEGWPTRYMARHGCAGEAGFSGNMTSGRFWSTALVVLVGMVVAVAVGMAAISLLVTKFLIAFLFLILPLAVLTAILPGGGRQLAWWWLGSLVQLWLTAFAMGSVLTLLYFAIDAIRATSETVDVGLTGRWVLVLLAVALVYRMRRTLSLGAQGVSAGITTGVMGAIAGQQEQAGDRPGSGQGVPGEASDSAVPGDESQSWDGASAGAPGGSTGGGGSSGEEEPGGGSGGFDPAESAEGVNRAATVGATVGLALGRAAVGVTGFALHGWYANLREERFREQRMAVKNQAWRTALDDQILVHTGQAPAARGARVPSARDVARRRVRLSMYWGGHYARAKRGGITPYTGGPRRMINTSTLFGFARPHHVRGADGKKIKVKPPRVGSVPRSQRRGSPVSQWGARRQQRKLLRRFR